MYWPESVCRDLSGALGKTVSESGGKADFEYHCTKGSVFLGAVNIMKYTQLGNKARGAENMTYTSALVFAGIVEKRNVCTYPENKASEAQNGSCIRRSTSTNIVSFGGILGRYLAVYCQCICWKCHRELFGDTRDQ